MIPLLPILGFARRFWPFILIAMVAAWGKLGWYRYESERVAYTDYREEQARLVVRQQERIIEERARVDEISRRAVGLYLAGQRATEEHHAPHIAALESLNRAYRERLRQHQAGVDSSAVPSDTAAAAGADAATCDQRLQRVIEAAAGVTADAERVARDLRDAELAVNRLIRLQAWTADVALSNILKSPLDKPREFPVKTLKIFDTFTALCGADTMRCVISETGL